MAPKSAAFITAKELWDAGVTRHEARLQLQLKYDRTMSKSRISQLLAHYWGPEEKETSMKAPNTGTKRKVEAMAEDKTKSTTNSDSSNSSTASSTDSSIARDRERLSAKAPVTTSKVKKAGPVGDGKVDATKSPAK